MFRLIEFGELLTLFIAMSVTALIAGATLAVLTFGRAASRKAQIAAIPIAIVGGFAVIMGGLIVDKQFKAIPPWEPASGRRWWKSGRPAAMERGASRRSRCATRSRDGVPAS